MSLVETEKTTTELPPENILEQIKQSLPYLHTDLSAKELLLSPEVIGKRLENIPLTSIASETTITDGGHTGKLKDSIFGKKGRSPFGQLIPILLRARLDENGNAVYDIIDGFHRTEALRTGGGLTAEAVVVYGVTDEDMYDLRILAASTFKSTKFARIALWMQRSFEESSFFREKNLSLLQVFSLASFDTSGVKLQLTKEEAEEVKIWAEEKSEIWNRTPSSIFQDLYLISRADPKIVAQVRVGSGGGHGEGSGVLNPARLKKMVEALPNKHELQQIVYQIIIQKDLDSDCTGLLSEALAKFEDESEIIEIITAHPEIMIIIAHQFKQNPDKWKELLMVSMYHDLNIEETKVFTQMVAQNINDEGTINCLYEDPKKYLILTGYISPTTEAPVKGKVRVKRRNMHSPLDKPVRGLGEAPEGSYSTETVQGLQKEVELLKKALKTAKKKAKNGQLSNSPINDPDWWRSAPDLSKEERHAYHLVFGEGLGFEQAAKIMQILPNRLAILLQSGAQRQVIAYCDILMDEIDKRYLKQ